jgi:hypothetical protein
MVTEWVKKLCISTYAIFLRQDYAFSAALILVFFSNLDLHLFTPLEISSYGTLKKVELG